MKGLTFGATTLVIFVFTFSAADSIGFVPCYVDDTCTSVALSNLPELGEKNIAATAPAAPEAQVALPERIRAEAVGMDLPVQDSSTRDIDELYEMLKKGPVRYVDSAKLGEEGNVLIFGHSSQLPIVTNKMYKAFNRVPDLKADDTITLEGGGKEYVYRVLSVKSVDVA